MKSSQLFLAFVFVVSALAGPANNSNVVSKLLQSATPSKRYLYLNQELDVPVSRFEVDWLHRRKQAQEGRARQYKVVHDFKFVDRLVESGITFQNSVVEDATKSYRPIHYDHGTGLAVADVDGDGLYDIYFVNQLGCNELWRNLGAGRFENITERAGIGLCGQVSVGASFADVDNDGNQDLFVTTVRHGNHLFHSLGNGNFRDVTEQAGLNYSGHASGAVFFDYNRDGLLDLFLCNVGHYTTDEKGRGGYYLGMDDGFSGHLHPDRTEPCILYKNLGDNRFQNVTEAAGLSKCGWSGDASFADLNGDGFPDLYVLNMQGNDHYYENVRGEKFVDRTDAFFPKTPWGSMGIKFFDFNNDGLTDLFVTDMHSDMSDDITYDHYPEERIKSIMKWEKSFTVGYEKSIFGNAFYKNLGEGKFVEISDQIGAENYWPWGVSVDDLNADGFQDVFISSGMSYHFRYGINSLLLNNFGQSFLDSEFVLSVEPRREGKTVTPWFEVDCSGQDANHPDCKGHNGKFTVLSSLSSRSSVIFDMDNDGDLDIVTNDFNTAPQVFISDLAQRRKVSFLKVNLVGSKSNRNGLGAQVTVSAGNLKITKTQDGKSGYLSQSVLPLYFGLGEATHVNSVEVLWPSGQKQIVSQAKTNTTIRIVEDTP
jgi:hypothetical protein